MPKLHHRLYLLWLIHYRHYFITVPLLDLSTSKLSSHALAESLTMKKDYYSATTETILRGSKASNAIQEDQHCPIIEGYSKRNYHYGSVDRKAYKTLGYAGGTY